LGRSAARFNMSNSGANGNTGRDKPAEQIMLSRSLDTEPKKTADEDYRNTIPSKSLLHFQGENLIGNT
jgi:hypothetical protein